MNTAFRHVLVLTLIIKRTCLVLNQIAPWPIKPSATCTHVFKHSYVQVQFIVCVHMFVSLFMRAAMILCTIIVPYMVVATSECTYIYI